MKSLQWLLSFATALAVAVFMALSVGGCKDKSTNPPEDLTVPDDIFPLVPGRQIEYNGYLTQNDTETKIANSDSGYYTKWSLFGTTKLSTVFGPLVPAGTTPDSGFLVKDTTKIPRFGVASKFTPIFVSYDPTTAKYLFFTNLGYFYRAFQIKASGQTTIRSDSLRWITLADPRVKLNNEFTSFGPESFSGTVSGSPATVVLTIKGKWEGKETITVGSTAYETFRLVVTRTVTLGTTTIAGGPTAKLWVAKGIGPVQMHLYGDAETHGNFRKMTAKNF